MRGVDERKFRRSIVTNGFRFRSWPGFYNYGRSTRKHRMHLALSFADHAVTGDGNDNIGRFFVTGRLMAQTTSVTVQRLTPGRMTFTIVASEKASGDYGNYLTSQVTFTFGQSENKKANTVKRARKSHRTSKPSWDNPIAHSHGKSPTHQQTE